MVVSLVNDMQIKKFTFNPFEENTYIVYDETSQCAIIDPGCYMPEEKELLGFIAAKAQSCFIIEYTLPCRSFSKQTYL